MKSTEEKATRRQGRLGAGRGLGLLALVLTVLVGAAACDNPLDVENPNNLVAEDLNNPQGLSAAVNGALSTTSRGISEMLAPYAAATDQIQNIGSRDAWLQLDFGKVANESNEFTDAAFPFMTEARYMADKSIRLAEEFDESGEIIDRTNLARAYFYGSIVYTAIGDMFDDFVISEPGKASPPIGPSNMNQVYQTALGYLDKGLPVARDVGARSLVTRMLAMKARIHYSLAVWNKLNPAGSTPSDPLVNSQQAVDFARQVLDRVGVKQDWRYDLQYTSSTVSNGLGDWIEGGYLNLEEGPTEGAGVVDLQEGSLTNIVGITFTDPIDTGTVPPEVKARVTDYSTNPEFAPITVVSAREMHLILAEAALAQGDTEGFTTHVNHVRAMDGLTSYDGQIPAMDMLQHSRRANLFLQGRRLADMYRFGVQAPMWQDGSAAASKPGTFFPITVTEIRSNPNLSR